MSDEVRINGALHSWSSVIFKANGEEWRGFTSISYSQTREREKFWGAGKHHAPIGMTAGKYDTEGPTITFRRGTAEQFRAFLAQQSNDGRSYGNAAVPMTLQFIEDGDVPILVEFDAARLVGESVSTEEGTGALVDEFTFACQKILTNGRTLFDSSLGAP